MKTIRSFLPVLALFALSAFAVKVGDQAPDFTGTDSHGQMHKLSDYRGKFVVLEWHNNGCPFTKKHYESGNMQKLQQEWTGKGVIWLTVISSSPGSQGYVTADQENEYLQKMHAVPTAALLDPKGDIGHLYGAKTTPHMFVLNPQGQIIYNGAIDDKATTDPSDVNGANNYVSKALQEAMSGRAVAVATTRPYGCSVKYAD
ncbi:MAG TPA: redoxin domain-containing protein [Terriglobales bacterium]|nr:redoxin domain-containing protein [Terriglobales bacterium]